MLLKRIYIADGYMDLNASEKLILRLYQQHSGDVAKIAQVMKHQTDEVQDPEYIKDIIRELIDSGLVEPMIPAPTQQMPELPEDKVARFGSMLANGYTEEEIAAALDVDLQIVRNAMEQRFYLVPGDYAHRITSRQRSAKMKEYLATPEGQDQIASRSGDNWYDWLKEFPRHKRAGIIAKTIMRYNHPPEKSLQILQTTLSRAGIDPGKAEALMAWAQKQGDEEALSEI